VIRDLLHKARVLVGAQIVRAGVRVMGGVDEKLWAGDDGPRAFDLPDYIDVAPGESMEVQSEVARRMVAEGAERAPRVAPIPPPPLKGSLQERFGTATARRPTR
jgi:hypothetical protein